MVLILVINYTFIEVEAQIIVRIFTILLMQVDTMRHLTTEATLNKLAGYLPMLFRSSILHGEDTVLPIYTKPINPILANLSLIIHIFSYTLIFHISNLTHIPSHHIL